MGKNKQLQEKDPKKMVENLKRAASGNYQDRLANEDNTRREAIGGGFSVTPSFNPDAETEAQIAAQQAQLVQQAQQNPEIEAKRAAINEMVRRANDERMRSMGQVPSLAEQIRRRNELLDQE